MIAERSLWGQQMIPDLKQTNPVASFVQIHVIV